MRIVRRQGANAMIGRQDRLFDFLDFSDQALAQFLGFFEQSVKANRIGFPALRLVQGQIELTIEFTDLTFERQRAERFALTPADNMSLHDFATVDDESIVWI